MRATGITLCREIAHSMYRPEVFTTIRLYNHRRERWWRCLSFPSKELFAIAAESDFYEMHDSFDILEIFRR